MFEVENILKIQEFSGVSNEDRVARADLIHQHSVYQNSSTPLLFYKVVLTHTKKT